MNAFAEISESFRISWDALRANKLRSVLTTLGMVIGIVTVTLMGATIQGLNQAFLSGVSSLGADVFYVERHNWLDETTESWLASEKRRPFRAADADVLAAQLTLAGAVTPAAGAMASVQYKNRSANGVYIIGTTEGYLLTSGIGLAEGRFLSAPDAAGGRPVCVVGAQVATNLFSNESAIGRRIKINAQSFEIVGVLEKQGSFLGMFSLDNRVVIPFRQLIATFTRNPDVSIQVKARELVQLDEAREELRQTLRRVRHLAPNDPDDFSINQQDEIVNLFHRETATIAVIGLCVTGLSLFVGGIGIMNIMFVSVTERTREIGIRKAIGARRRTILLQFLTEAVCIGLLGGLIGLGIAEALTFVIERFLPAVMTWLILGVAFLVSLVTGVVSGFLPAWRASRMDPVDALRYE